MAPDGNFLQLFFSIRVYWLCLAFIPNSSFRAELKRKEIQPVEVEVFRLRLV